MTTTLHERPCGCVIERYWLDRFCTYWRCDQWLTICRQHRVVVGG